MNVHCNAFIFFALIGILQYPSFVDSLRRCFHCRSRGELGTCKDPFKMNSTEMYYERGVSAVPCASGWCAKIIESQNLNNEYGTATQRMCLQRGPDDGEERCAYTVYSNKKVYMCFCTGDLCNAAYRQSAPSTLMSIMFFILIRWII